MGDLAIVGLLIAFTVGGARRGFFRELFAVASFFIAIAVAVRYHVAIAPALVGMLKLENAQRTGYALAAAALFVPTYLVLALIGRRVVARVKERRAEERRAEEAARAGPVTRVFKPVPSAAGIFYRLDKGLGFVLGLTKGAIVAFLALYFADHWSLGRPGEALRSSIAMNVYQQELVPALSRLPEVRAVRQLPAMHDVLRLVVENDPAREALRAHPQVQAIGRHPGAQALVADGEFQKAVREHDHAGIVKNPKLIRLLLDREFLKLIAAVDVPKLRADLEASIRSSGGVVPVQAQGDGRGGPPAGWPADGEGGPPVSRTGPGAGSSPDRNPGPSGRGPGTTAGTGSRSPSPFLSPPLPAPRPPFAPPPPEPDGDEPGGGWWGVPSGGTVGGGGF